MGTRYFALISGILYVLVGLSGFVPALVAAPGVAPTMALDTGYGYLMGLFPINVLHNIVHLGVGIWGLTSYRSYLGARTYARGLSIFYAVLAIMGLFPIMNTTFGLIPIFGHDIWLHAGTAAIAAYFGFKTPNEAELRSDERPLAS